MNTDSGRIYDPDEYTARLEAMGVHLKGSVREEAARMHADKEQAEFETAMAAQKIVAISDKVARMMKIGQRVEARRNERRLKRRAKNKVARASRKKNRG